MTDPAEYVAALRPKLRSARVTYFPVRHHSPACAAHLQRWIAAHRPAAVLVYRLTAYDPAAGRVREFAIHRVTSVVAADETIMDA